MTLQWFIITQNIRSESLVRVIQLLITSSFSSLAACCLILCAAAILLCLEPLRPPTRTNHYCAPSLSLIILLLILWNVFLIYPPHTNKLVILHPMRLSLNINSFRKQISSTTLPYTDYAVTSLKHCMTLFYLCRKCFTLPFYLPISFTRLYCWRELIIFYLSTYLQSKVFGTWHTRNKHFCK